MWTFQLPVRVCFGDGVANEAPARAAEYGSRPIIVTDETLAALPGIQALIASFGPAQVFAQVEPNPTVANVDALAQMIRAGNADVLVAIGGGSPLDCAKAAACLAPSGAGSIRAFHSEGQKLDNRRLPLIALPTTAGTGSEVTPFAVLDDREKEIKGPIAAEALYPTLALVDPELTHSLPRFVTAATALDALSHAIEGYWSKNHQPICDLLAKEAAQLIFQHFERVMENPGDRDARAALSYAALLAGMAFQLPKNAMVHACSYPLSNRYHLCHGAACAFTLEFAIRLNASHTHGRLEAFAAACGLDSPEAMAQTIRRFKRLGGLPCTLADAGIPETAIESIISESFHPLINNNPKAITPDDLRALYESLIEA